MCVYNIYFIIRTYMYVYMEFLLFISVILTLSIL